MILNSFTRCPSREPLGGTRLSPGLDGNGFEGSIQPHGLVTMFGQRRRPAWGAIGRGEIWARRGFLPFDQCDVLSMHSDHAN